MKMLLVLVEISLINYWITVMVCLLIAVEGTLQHPDLAPSCTYGFIHTDMCTMFVMR